MERLLDVTVTGASKPSFFTSRNPFKIVDEEGVVHGEEYKRFDPQDSIKVETSWILGMFGIHGERVVHVGISTEILFVQEVFSLANHHDYSRDGSRARPV